MKKDILYDLKYYLWTKPVDKLKEIKNYFCSCWKYRKLLKDDHDWDYYFTLFIMEKKLKHLSDYMYKANRYENENTHAWQCKIAYNLLKIINEEEETNYLTSTGDHDWKDNKDGTYTMLPGDLKWSYNHYVNIKNSKRFLHEEVSKKLDINDENYDENYTPLILNELYKEKAWRLFWKWCNQYMRYWWD